MTADFFTTYSDVIKAGNPYHDSRGRFTTGPVSKIMSEYKRWRGLVETTASYDDKIAAGETMLLSLEKAKLSKAEWHKLAKALGMGSAASTSGVRVRQRIIARIHATQSHLRGSRAMGGRSAA